jgi:hypothetical protein
MFARPPLLTAQQGKEGSFVVWLEDVGLRDFIRRYPLSKLVDWGWLVPQSRIVFPAEYFLVQQEFPFYPTTDTVNSQNFDIEDRLWSSEWCIKNDQSTLWFLHPFFHPGDTCGDQLSSSGYAANPKPIPSEFTHPFRSVIITPYADYYFHWQAYALIDVIRSADCISPIINTPEVEEDAQAIVRIAAICKSNTPSDIIKPSNRWGGLAEPMTWVSHYRAFRDALFGNEDKSLHEKGAKQLAEHLGIDADILEHTIKEKLLTLASDWLWANDRYCEYTLRAWPYLQKDIKFALEWLCIIGDKNFGFYQKKWKWPSLSRHEWAELHKVLPYEFFEDRQYFLSYAPKYNKNYKGVLPDGDKLERLVDYLQAANPPFRSFLNAFRQLHEQLVHNPKQKGSLDFRALRPLDYYSLLAIRAEVCLRCALQESGSLGNAQSLATYIETLAKKRTIQNRVIDFFKTKGALTNFKDTPQHPIGDIMSLQHPRRWSKADFRLAQAFLCCNLARNYFAHHNYLDEELIRTEKSAFMLSGILITVLTLLDTTIP